MLLRREVLPPPPHDLRWAGWIVGGGIAVVVAFSAVVWPRVIGCDGESKADVARATVKQYAYEAYPSWRQVNRGVACPHSLLDLDPWMNRKDDRDPWGEQYVLVCSDNKLVVLSSGEDGVFGTADDLRSDELLSLPHDQ